MAGFCREMSWMKNGIILTGKNSYFYRVKTDDVIIVGGFAPGLTGEGIYQSLVSGETAARIIMDETYIPVSLEKVFRYNWIQKKIMNILVRSGPFRMILHEMLIQFLNLPPVKRKIHHSFTGR
jgi:flavin-dependent dehydrogenase